MPTIGLISESKPSQWLRYFQEGEPTWKDARFKFEGDFSDCDIVFVYDAVPKHLCGTIKHEKFIFLAAEPPSIKKYSDVFLSQFSLVYSVDQSIRHPNLLIGRMPALWHIGLWNADGRLLDRPLGLNDFKQLNVKKSKNVSVISSSKSYSLGHRARLEFVDKVKDYFGNDIDVFGRGRKSFGDKIEVIPQYRYHIALENSYYYDYWTEKLSDAFISQSYPIYNGCPNVLEYFSKSQISTINIRDIEGSIMKIKRLIESDLSEISASDLKLARDKILLEYNIINLLWDLAKSTTRQEDNTRKIQLFSENYCKKFPSSYLRHASFTVRSLAKRVISSAAAILPR